MPDLPLGRLSLWSLLPILLLTLTAGHATAEQPSPPVLDRKSGKVWIDSGYI